MNYMEPDAQIVSCLIRNCYDNLFLSIINYILSKQIFFVNSHGFSDEAIFSGGDNLVQFSKFWFHSTPFHQKYNLQPMIWRGNNFGSLEISYVWIYSSSQTSKMSLLNLHKNCVFLNESENRSKNWRNRKNKSNCSETSQKQK